MPDHLTQCFLTYFSDQWFRALVRCQCPHAPGLWLPPCSGQDSPTDPTAHTQSPAVFAFPSLGRPQPRHTPPETDSQPLSACRHCPLVVHVSWPGPGARARGLRLLSWSVEFLDTKQMSVLRDLCCAVSGTGLWALPADPARWAQKRAWQSFLSQEMLAEAYVQSVHHGVFYTSRKNCWQDS